MLTLFDLHEVFRQLIWVVPASVMQSVHTDLRGVNLIRLRRVSRPVTDQLRDDVTPDLF